MGFARAFVSLFFTEDGQKSPTAASARPTYTVLAIDDDQSYLETIRSLLRDAGFEVMISATGPKGLNLLKYAPQNFQFVLLDFSMPSYDGLQTLNYVRKLAPKAKVLGISGIEAKRLPTDFRDGVDRFIQKPFTTAELIDSLLGMTEEKPAARSARLEAAVANWAEKN